MRLRHIASGSGRINDYFHWLATMVTTNPPPDEAEGSSGSGYAYAAENIIASPLHQTVEARGTLWCSVYFIFFSQVCMYAAPSFISCVSPYER